MSTIEISSQHAADARTSNPSKKRLIGIDAARGLALIGLMAIHVFPSESGDGGPTLSWTLFSGDSAALFALLAGLGLALSSGGRTPHQGRELTGDRIGLITRAFLIGTLGLLIAETLPDDPPPAFGILLYYAVFFLLAMPFLGLRPWALFISAVGFALVSPVLMQKLDAVLPESSDYNHTLGTLIAEPAGTVSEMLITGSYPALTFMVYVLVGLGLGRLDLRSTRVQAVIAGVGTVMAVLANMVSHWLLHTAGGYQALLATPDMTPAKLHETLTYGPDILPDTSAWWLAIATPHSNAPLAIAASLGTGLAVLGVFLLLGARTGRLLAPLATMGAMTLTLYSAHLLALGLMLHYDMRTLWFLVHVGAAAAFAWCWQHWRGQGPLEAVVSRSVKGMRTVVRNWPKYATTGTTADEAADSSSVGRPSA